MSKPKLIKTHPFRRYTPTLKGILFASFDAWRSCPVSDGGRVSPHFPARPGLEGIRSGKKSCETFRTISPPLALAGEMGGRTGRGREGFRS